MVRCVARASRHEQFHGEGGQVAAGTAGWRPDQTSSALIAACGEAYTVASCRVGRAGGGAGGRRRRAAAGLARRSVRQARQRGTAAAGIPRGSHALAAVIAKGIYKKVLSITQLKLLPLVNQDATVAH